MESGGGATNQTSKKKTQGQVFNSWELAWESVVASGGHTLPVQPHPEGVGAGGGPLERHDDVAGEPAKHATEQHPPGQTGVKRESRMEVGWRSTLGHVIFQKKILRCYVVVIIASENIKQ